MSKNNKAYLLIAIIIGAILAAGTIVWKTMYCVVYGPPSPDMQNNGENVDSLDAITDSIQQKRPEPVVYGPNPELRKGKKPIHKE